MSENPILDWFRSDDTLSDIVNQITATQKSLEEQALDAFHQISDYYDLPRYPESFSEKYYDLFEKMDV